MFSKSELAKPFVRVRSWMERQVIRCVKILATTNPLIRAILAFTLVFLLRWISPEYPYGPYKICVIDFSVGFIAVLMAFGGRNRYVLPSFLAILAYYMCSFNNNHYYATFITAVISILPTYLGVLILDKLDINNKSDDSLGKIINCVITLCIIPTVISLVLVFASYQLWKFDPFMGVVCYERALKILIQTRLARFLSLWMWVAWACVVWIDREHGLRCMVHTGAFLFVALSTTLLIFNVQYNSELSLTDSLFKEHAKNFRRTVEKEIRLELFGMQRLGEHLANVRSLCPTRDDVSRMIEQAMGDHTMVSYIGFCPYVPEHRVSEYEKKFQTIKLVDNKKFVLNDKGEVAYFPLAYLDEFDESFPTTFKEFGTDLSDLQEFKCAFLDALKYVNHDPINCSRHHYFVTTIGKQQLIFRHVFHDRKLLGVLFMGIRYRYLLREVCNSLPGRYGVRGMLYCDKNTHKDETIFFDNNTTADSVYSATEYVNINLLQDDHLLKLELTSIPRDGIFLNNALNEFFLYNIFLIGFVFLLNIIYLQLLSVSDKVEVATREVVRHARYNGMVLDTMSEMLVTTDQTGKIVAANPAACANLKIEASQLIGMNIHKLLHNGSECVDSNDCELIKYYQDINDKFSSEECDINQEKAKLRVHVNSASDISHEYELHFATIEVVSEGGFNVIISMRDITQEVNMQKMRSEYLAMLSHEMRTPLSCIKGTVDMLGKFSGRLITNNEFNALGNNMIDVASRNVDTLTRLINDVLLVDEVENNKLRLDTSYQELAPIVAKVVEELQSKAQSAQVTLVERDIQGIAVMDQVRIGQVLHNFITNAIKYSPKNGEVVIASFIDEKLNALVVAVCDQGEGIPTEKIGNIFDRFEVVDSSSVRKRGGMGLGLAICRGLIIAHGGLVWLESKVNVGSNFYFALPLTDKSECESAARLDIELLKQEALKRIPLLNA